MPGMFVYIILKYSSAIAKSRVPGDKTELDRLSVKPVLQSAAQVFLDFRTSAGMAKKIPNKTALFSFHLLRPFFLKNALKYPVKIYVRYSGLVAVAQSKTSANISIK